jgi:DHA2 family multidrug resistance protein
MQALYTQQSIVAHADAASQVQPSNPVFNSSPPGMGPPLLPSGGAGSPPGSGSLETLNGAITGQSAMVALIDVFKLMLILVFAIAPLLLLMRRPRAAGAPSPEMAVE